MDNEQLEALERLAELKQRGILTDAEVQAQKRRILSASSGVKNLDRTSDSIPRAPAGDNPESRPTSHNRRVLGLLIVVSAAIVLFFVAVRDDSAGPEATSVQTTTRQQVTPTTTSVQTTTTRQQVTPTTTSVQTTTRADDQGVRVVNDRLVLSTTKYSEGKEGSLWEIVVMNPDGTDLRQLTDNNVIDWDPAWSPDGKHIAFVSDRDGDEDIYVMNSDGTGVRDLTETSRNEWDPDWSNDGKHIVYIGNTDPDAGFDGQYWEPQESDYWQVVVMNSDGTNKRNLTALINHYPRNPKWSPDDEYIAFETSRVCGEYMSGDPAVTTGVYVMNADGTGMRLLSSDRSMATSPAWSPDGKKIVFASGLCPQLERVEVGSGNEHYNTELWIINTDGTGLNRLTHLDLGVRDPTWSPDGKYLAFTVISSICDQLFIIDIDENRMTNVFNNSRCWIDPNFGRFK